MASILRFRVYQTRSARWRWALESTATDGRPLVWARSGSDFSDASYAVSDARLIVDRLRFEQVPIEVDATAGGRR